MNNVLLPQRNQRDEDGFTLVIFALSVVVLMIFVAFAIDIGAGLDERREDVSAVDGAVLAAAQDVDDAVMRDTAISYAEKTLGVGPTTTGLADATLDWAACTDPGQLPRQAPGTKCVSFSLDRSLVRARIPVQSLQYFGGVAGLDAVQHSAAAIARRVDIGIGGILPFGLGDGTGHLCLRSDSGGNATLPCDGPNNGNFGEGDFKVFATSDCGTGGEDARFQYNASQGVDHPLGRSPGPFSGLRSDASVCAGSAAGAANAVAKGSGLTAQKAAEAILHGITYNSTNYLGRLARSTPGWWGAAGAYRTTIEGTNIDDIELWEFIGDNNSDNTVPEACHRNQFAGGGSMQNSGANIDAATWTYVSANYPALTDKARVLLERCFALYVGSTWNHDNPADGIVGASPPNADPDGYDFVETRDLSIDFDCTNVATTAPCTGAVFTRADGVAAIGSDAKIDLQLSSRFGYAPKLWQAFPPSNPVGIERFRAVYLYGICGNTCDGDFRHEPGAPAVPTNNPKTMGDFTAFAFHDNMLPFQLSSPDAPFDLGTNVRIELFR